jgi:hypothetical protein
MALSESALEDAFLAGLFQGGPNHYPHEGQPSAPGLSGEKGRKSMIESTRECQTCSCGSSMR